MSADDRDGGKKKVTGVSIEKELLDWADDHFGDLGYTSRSDLLNDQLRRLREMYRDDRPAAETEDTDE